MKKTPKVEKEMEQKEVIKEPECLTEEELNSIKQCKQNIHYAKLLLDNAQLEKQNADLHFKNVTQEIFLKYRLTPNVDNIDASGKINRNKESL